MLVTISDLLSYKSTDSQIHHICHLLIYTRGGSVGLATKLSRPLSWLIHKGTSSPHTLGTAKLTGSTAINTMPLWALGWTQCHDNASNASLGRNSLSCSMDIVCIRISYDGRGSGRGGKGVCEKESLAKAQITTKSNGFCPCTLCSVFGSTFPRMTTHT